MKKTIFILILVLLVAASFSLSGCIPLGIRLIKGSGTVITEQYDVKDFDSIDFSGVGTINIVQDGKESLRVSAEDNIIDNLSVEVRGRTLYISPKRVVINLVPTRDVTFDLHIAEMKEIKISGAGSVQSDMLEVKDLKIDSSGLGNIVLGIYGESLITKISGAARFEVSGEVKTQEIDISGLGTYNAKDLISNDCKISISGSGNAEVNVVQNLEIEISGLGSVEYMGSPSVKQNISGGGSIKSLD
jgi:hypothetical protein